MRCIPIVFSFILPQLLQSLNAVDLISPTQLVEKYNSDFKDATHSLYLFDNDGVLKPPMESASPEEQLLARKILTELAANEKNEVWVISGSSLWKLKEQYKDILRLNLAGSFGAEIQKYGEGIEAPYGDFAEPTEALAQSLLRWAKPEDLDVRRSGTIIFGHGGIDNAYTQSVRTAIQELTRSGPFKSVDYNKFTLISPKDCHKGRLASTLLQKHTEPRFFAISLGDHSIDVPMFRALEQHSRNYGINGKAVSILVGSADDVPADHRLVDPRAVYQFFCHLLGISYTL